jgi:hypothetical protein
MMCHPTKRLRNGAADASGEVDIDDVIYFIAYIFSGCNVPCNIDRSEAPNCYSMRPHEVFALDNSINDGIIISASQISYPHGWTTEKGTFIHMHSTTEEH